MTESLPGLRRQSAVGPGNPSVANAIRTLIDTSSEQWMYCTIPDDELVGVAGASRIVRLRRGASTPLSDMIEKRILISHVIAHPATKTSEDGEVHTFARVLLIGPHDDCYSCGAMSVLDSLDELAALGLRPPFSPPLAVVVHQKATTPPRRIFWLEPISHES